MQKLLNTTRLLGPTDYRSLQSRSRDSVCVPLFFSSITLWYNVYRFFLRFRYSRSVAPSLEFPVPMAVGGRERRSRHEDRREKSIGGQWTPRTRGTDSKNNRCWHSVSLSHPVRSGLVLSSVELANPQSHFTQPSQKKKKKTIFPTPSRSALPIFPT